MSGLIHLVSNLVVVWCILLIQDQWCIDAIRRVRFGRTSENPFCRFRASQMFNLAPHHLSWYSIDSVCHGLFDVCLHQLLKQLILAFLSARCRYDCDQRRFLCCRWIPADCLPVLAQSGLNSCSVSSAKCSRIFFQNHLTEFFGLISIILCPAQRAGFFIRWVCSLSGVCFVSTLSIYLTARLHSSDNVRQYFKLLFVHDLPPIKEKGAVKKE